MAAFWTLVTGLCCMAVIRVIQHMDQHLPGMEAGDMALLWLLAGVVFFVTDGNYLSTAVLFAICYIAAYTDYKTRNIYTIVNVAGLTAGVVINIVENKEFLAGMILVCILMLAFWFTGAMKWGDVELLVTVYPLMANIIGNQSQAFLVYLLLIMTALIISIVYNFKAIWKNWRYRTCYAPYHLAATILFLMIST